MMHQELPMPAGRLGERAFCRTVRSAMGNAAAVTQCSAATSHGKAAGAE